MSDNGTWCPLSGPGIFPTAICIFMAAAIISFTGCKKEEDEIPDESIITVIDVTDHFVEWIYFSFSDDTIVKSEPEDAATDTGWDLGIRYQNFRTNGGESGPGQGGVYDLGKTDFSAVTLASKEGVDFVEDDMITVLESEAMPPSWIEVSGSVPMEDMFTTPTGPDRTYAPNMHVYILKSAEGRHIKIKGVSFFDDYGDEGHIKLRWEFLD